MPSLILGQRVDEINRFFESDKFVWSSNPKFGFSLFAVSYMRLYALMNHRTGPMKGLLSQKAQENFEKQMWAVAKANSKLAEAKRNVWDMEGSENHHLASKTCDLLAAQFLRNIPAYANQKYDDGSTLAEQYEARRAYFLKWFDERAKRGQFVEAGSPSYQGDSISALFNLRDFAEDPVLRKKAEMYLDLTYAAIAEETLLTTRGGPKSRVKVGHEYDGGFCDRGYDLLFNAPGRTFVPLGVGACSTSNYYPPPAIVNLAQDTTGRGTYVFAKRWPGPVAEGRRQAVRKIRMEMLWRTLDPERSVLRYGFATPSYVIGSAGLDAAWLDDASMGFRWQGVVFASDPLARIGFEVKPASTKDWHGFNPFFSVQDRNILITQKWAPVPPNPRSAMPAYLRVYFSPTLDEVQEEGGWIFVKDGGAFAAVKVVAGGYQWTPAWKHADRVERDNKAFITLDAENCAGDSDRQSGRRLQSRFRGVQIRGKGAACPLRGRRPALCHDHLLRPLPARPGGRQDRQPRACTRLRLPLHPLRLEQRAHLHPKRKRYRNPRLQGSEQPVEDRRRSRNFRVSAGDWYRTADRFRQTRSLIPTGPVDKPRPAVQRGLRPQPKRISVHERRLVVPQKRGRPQSPIAVGENR